MDDFNREGFIKALPRNILIYYLIVPIILFFGIRYLWGRGGHLLSGPITWGTIVGLIVGVVYGSLLVAMGRMVRSELQAYAEQRSPGTSKGAGRTQRVTIEVDGEDQPPVGTQRFLDVDAALARCSYDLRAIAPGFRVLSVIYFPKLDGVWLSFAPNHPLGLAYVAWVGSFGMVRFQDAAMQQDLDWETPVTLGIEVQREVPLGFFVQAMIELSLMVRQVLRESGSEWQLPSRDEGQSS